MVREKGGYCRSHLVEVNQAQLCPDKSVMVGRSPESGLEGSQA